MYGVVVTESGTTTLSIIYHQDEEDIDAAIQEVKDIFGDDGDHVYQESTSDPADYRSLLTVEHKYLNSDNEMRRIFGAKVVGSDQG